MRQSRRTSAAERLKVYLAQHPTLTSSGKVKNLHSVVTVKCPTHGRFKASVLTLVSRETPCTACRHAAAHLTNVEFLKRARKVHGRKFDYTKTLYINGKTKVTIGCKKHGEFRILPHQHLRGPGGCPACKVGRLTQEEFVKRSKKIFPRRYEYANTVYAGLDRKVTITCMKHGDFSQFASNHLSKREGCPECQQLARNPLGTNSVSARSLAISKELKNRRLTQEQFLKRAKKVHGKKYTYEKAAYRTQYDSVIVTCPDHGDFPIRPGNLWTGSGCPQCAKSASSSKKRLSPEAFLKRARKKHGDQYDLSEVRYTTMTVKVTPTCRIHGPFEVLPHNFLKGTGCPLCSVRKRVKAHIESAHQRDIVSEFVAVHGAEYNYSKVVYKGLNAPVTIICKKHSGFEQKATYHLQGKGCPKCGEEAKQAQRYLTQDEAIALFREEHGKLFDYSKFVYKNYKTKGIVICRKHGDFEMTPQKHVEGQGCPSCSESIGERQIARWLEERKVAFVRQFAIKLKKSHSMQQRVRFDFLIPEERLLIEFDGEQHFRPVTFLGMKKSLAEEIFYRTVKRDKAKTRWAKNNSYTLLRIRYDETIGARLQATFMRTSLRKLAHSGNAA